MSEPEASARNSSPTLPALTQLPCFSFHPSVDKSSRTVDKFSATWSYSHSGYGTPPARSLNPPLRLLVPEVVDAISTDWNTRCFAVTTRRSRREFLKIGAVGLGGLTLTHLLRSEAAAGSVLAEIGHLDLPGRRSAAPGHVRSEADAPKGNRRAVAATATNVTGIQICEALPRLAQIMDKLVSSVPWSAISNDHDAIQVFHGHHPRSPRRRAAGRSSARRREGSRGDRSGDSAVHQPLLYLHARARTTSLAPGFLGAAQHHFGRWARRGTTWCSAAFGWNSWPTARRSCGASTPSAATSMPAA